MKKKLRFSAIFTTILTLILCTSYFGNAKVVQAVSYMTVHVMDVYDSGYVVNLPNGKVMVVDAGSSDELSNVYTKLDALGVTHIDYLVGTHQHGDHIGNFNNIINSGKYTIGGVYFPENSPCNNDDCNWMKNAASTHGIPVHLLNTGDRIFPTTTVNGLTLSSWVFAPKLTDDYSGDYTPGSASYVNAYSLVFHINYGGEQILFTGDLMPYGQDELTALNPLANHQIVTAPHHGYNGSVRDSFLDYMEAAGTDKIVIHNPKDCGTVVDFKYRLQTRGGSSFWSTEHNHDFYFQTDGTSWTSSQSAEWAPGNAVVAPPPHACP